MRIVWLFFLLTSASEGLLYPRESPTRDSRSLDGLWNFRVSPSLEPQKGFEERWFSRPLSQSGDVIDMPVPSSYNDITTEAALRDFVGWAWYDTTFYTPTSWMTNSKIILRFGSVHYTAVVYVNGNLAIEHEVGHLPFEVEVTDYLLNGRKNLLTVAVNNTLTPVSIPQGEWKWRNESKSYPKSYFEMEYTFDFFNYAGIHRPVTLHAVPKEIAIEDITVVTKHINEAETEAELGFHIEVDSKSDFRCEVELIDGDEKIASHSNQCRGILVVKRPKLWWPFLMHPRPGHMYTFRVKATSKSTLIEDVYELPIGIRIIEWDKYDLKINRKKFYFRGLGKHEDANVRGKGLDLPTVTKDFNLMEWLSANSFRTSHYPYADEIMDVADRRGFVVIDECPGVNLHHFDGVLLNNHRHVMEALVDRDKNHPSVVMWSIGNEPTSEDKRAREYFQTIADFTRSLDPTRPVTVVIATNPFKDQVIN